MCVTLYEVVYVYEAGSVCPHAPIRHLNSVSQSLVPPEWTVRHGHCGQQMGQPGGPWHLGPGLQPQPALGSAHSLNQHCVCSPLGQLVGMGVKAECLSVLQTPHWRRGFWVWSFCPCLNLESVVAILTFGAEDGELLLSPHLRSSLV